MNCQPETVILPFKDVWWHNFFEMFINWDTWQPGLQLACYFQGEHWKQRSESLTNSPSRQCNEGKIGLSLAGN